jgi:hypothetical protein
MASLAGGTHRALVAFSPCDRSKKDQNVNFVNTTTVVCFVHWLIYYTYIS